MQATQALQTFDQLVQRAILARLLIPRIKVYEVSLVSRRRDQAIWAQFNLFFPHLDVCRNGSTEQPLHLQQRNLLLAGLQCPTGTRTVYRYEHDWMPSPQPNLRPKQNTAPRENSQRKIKHEMVAFWLRNRFIKQARDVKDCASLPALDHPVRVVGTNVTMATCDQVDWTSLGTTRSSMH